MADHHLGESRKRQRFRELRGDGQSEQHRADRDVNHRRSKLHGDAGGGGVRIQPGSIERGAGIWSGERVGDGDGAGGMRVDGGQ